MKYNRNWFIGICLVGCCFSVFAETRYVTDELQLSLHELINSQGKLLQRLNSGDELELLEEEGFFAKVRTKDGTEGWTKARFLITRKPARAQLLEVQQQNQQLTGKLAQSENELKQAKDQLANIKYQEEQTNAELQGQLKSTEDVVAALDRVQQENEALRQHRTGFISAIPLNWGLIAAATCFTLGLVTGFALFDYRSRKRHGGYRIY